GTYKELKAIKKAVGKFEIELKEKIKSTSDKSLCKSLKKILDKLKEHENGLFSDPHIVKINGRERIIFIHRTNNILEHHFRRFNYSCRRIHGNQSIRRNLEHIPEQLPIVENLKKKNYVQLIFGDETKIVEKFSKIDVEKIREMNKEVKKKHKIYASNKIKKTIRKSNFKEILISSFVAAAI
ncbi:hypothetical protein MHK_009978, partial [Candidatus Magnetomorum sp. HK-1]